MGKKVLMLLSNEFKPDVRVEKEARALAEKGYDVTVVAWDRGRGLSKEEHGEFSVIRIRAGKVRTKARLLLNLPRFYLDLIRTASKVDPDCVYSHDLDTLPAGVAIAKIRRKPLVYDAHEHYAEMVRGDVPGFVSDRLDNLERASIRSADLVIAANDKIAEYLQPWYGKSVNVVMNCIDLPQKITKEDEEKGKGLTLFYGGSLEPLRFIEEAISVCDRDERLRLRIAGTGTLRGKVEAAAASNPRITFLGYLEHGKLLQEMAKSDAAIVLLDPSNKNNKIGTPNRLFEAMAVATPAIVAKGTLSGEIVEQERCGVAIEWSEEAFSEALTLLVDPQARREMGDNGRMAAEKKYNWGKMKAVFIESFESAFK